MLSLSQSLAKVFSVALLATVNPLWRGIWLSVDYGVFFLQKIIRRDFVYFPPIFTGLLKYVVALIARLLVKLLADATGYVNMRLAYERGGAYYSFNVVMSQASCWIAAALYVEYYAEGGNKIDATSIFVFIGGLQSLWIISTFLFFSKIKRKHWRKGPRE